MAVKRQALKPPQTAEIDPTAVLGPNVVIGPGVKIGAGVRLQRCVVLSNAVVRDHAWVANSIIGWNSNVGRWVSFSFEVVKLSWADGCRLVLKTLLSLETM